jgi:hypothetical protein
MFEETVQCQNIDNEEINPMDLLTPNEAFDAIQLYDSSV